MALTYIQAESTLTKEKKRKKIRLLTSPKPSVSFIFLLCLSCKSISGGARGVIVIVAGIGHGDSSSNPRRD